MSSYKFLQTQVYVVVQGRYIVQVRLNGYSNPTGRCQECPQIQRLKDGQWIPIHSCCDNHHQTNCSDNDLCDSFLIYCLRPFGETRLNLTDETIKRSFVYEDDAVIDLDYTLNLSGLGYSYEVGSSII